MRALDCQFQQQGRYDTTRRAAVYEGGDLGVGSDTALSYRTRHESGSTWFWEFSTETSSDVLASYSDAALSKGYLTQGALSFSQRNSRELFFCL